MWLALMDTWYVFFLLAWRSLLIQTPPRTSATACAHFYNTSMTQSNEPPSHWAFKFTLSSEHVWSAFQLYCLLEDVMERQEYLVVKHSGDQKDRFLDLVQARNQCMRIDGQPEVTHFCDKCTRWFSGADGKSKCSLFTKPVYRC